MKRWLTSLLILVLIFFASNAKGQTITNVYVDPCDNKVYTVSFPLTNIGVLIVIRGESKIFTANDFRSGAVDSWVRSIFAKPCPTNQQTAQVVT